MADLDIVVVGADLVAVALMACQFGVIEVVVTSAAAVIIAFPLLLLARRYTPGATRAVAG